MTQVLVINGPNLNLLGEREPGQYGQRSLQEILDDMITVADGCGVSLSHIQSNSEGELIDNIISVIPQIIDYERTVRQTLVESKRDVLEDKIWRAFGVLRSARIISSKETMEALSLVRMGVNLGVIEKLSVGNINELFILSQPGHLQKMEGTELKSMERDITRARFIREFLESVPA